MPAYEAVIGLEVHAQLLTSSKLFCSCPVRFGDEPNENICEVCAGMPGALPRMNKKAVELAPDNASYLFDLGTAYYLVGDAVTGEEYRSRAIAIDPNVLKEKATGN